MISLCLEFTRNPNVLYMPSFLCTYIFLPILCSVRLLEFSCWFHFPFLVPTLCFCGTRPPGPGHTQGPAWSPKAQVNVFSEELCKRQRTWLGAISPSVLSWMHLKELDLNETNLSNLKSWCHPRRKRRRSGKNRKRKTRMKRQKGKMKAQVLLVARWMAKRSWSSGSTCS